MNTENNLFSLYIRYMFDACEITSLLIPLAEWCVTHTHVRSFIHSSKHISYRIKKYKQMVHTPKTHNISRPAGFPFPRSIVCYLARCKHLYFIYFLHHFVTVRIRRADDEVIIETTKPKHEPNGHSRPNRNSLTLITDSIRVFER